MIRRFLSGGDTTGAIALGGVVRPPAVVPATPIQAPRRAPGPGRSTAPNVGIIWNSKARLNVAREVQFLNGPRCAMPRTHAELHEALANFAARKVDTLVVDGGDGTIRDVLSAASVHFAGCFPQIAIIPSGKTNALAMDIGVPKDWTIQAALNAATYGGTRARSPMEISYAGSAQPALSGFIFGTGAFVRATGIAQLTHSVGAFNGLAVGLSIAGGIAQTIFGRRDNVWRRGEPIRIEQADGGVIDREHYLLLASTLRSLPTGIRPFGRVRSGLKLLLVDAPPRRILSSLPFLLGGSEAKRLDDHGFHRGDAEQLRVTLSSGFILDGEAYAGGEISLRQGEPIRFIVP